MQKKLNARKVRSTLSFCGVFLAFLLGQIERTAKIKAAIIVILSGILIIGFKLHKHVTREQLAFYGKVALFVGYPLWGLGITIAARRSHCPKRTRRNQVVGLLVNRLGAIAPGTTLVICNQVSPVVFLVVMFGLVYKLGLQPLIIFWKKKESKPFPERLRYRTEFIANQKKAS